MLKEIQQIYFAVFLLRVTKKQTYYKNHSLTQYHFRLPYNNHIGHFKAFGIISAYSITVLKKSWRSYIKSLGMLVEIRTLDNIRFQ